MTQIQLINPSSKSIEQCIREAYESFNVPPLGGASTDGWSKMNDFQRCPYRYWLMYEPHEHGDGVGLGGKPAALEIGALFHAMLAMHYISIPTSNYPTALALVARVEALGGDPVIVNECTRLYVAYFNQYQNPQDEGITPIAIELAAGRAPIHTCRFDMLATINGGTWIVEHKTASRETRDVLESWWLDGEIIGEVLGYKLSGLESVYGPLVGVLVNLTIKTWAWDHCRDANATDDERLNRLLKLSLNER